MDAYDPVEILRDILPKSQHKRIPQIIEALGLDLDPEPVSEVAVVDARVPVERVVAYGLEIELDANGNAATVFFPYGGEVR